MSFSGAPFVPGSRVSSPEGPGPAGTTRTLPTPVNCRLGGGNQAPAGSVRPAVTAPPDVGPFGAESANWVLLRASAACNRTQIVSFTAKTVLDRRGNWPSSIAPAAVIDVSSIIPRLGETVASAPVPSVLTACRAAHSRRGRGPASPGGEIACRYRDPRTEETLYRRRFGNQADPRASRGPCPAPMTQKEPPATMAN